MPTMTDQKVCGVRHILIPANDPKNKVSSQQIQNFVGQIVNHLQKNPNDFGAVAYNYSLDPTKTSNQPLQSCLSGVKKEDPKIFKEGATQCLTKHVGELDCFKPAEMQPEWNQKVQHMKPGAIDSVFLKELNAFSVIQKPLNK